MNQNISTLIFFLRHDEPRNPDQDLYATLIQQTAVVEEFDVPVTYLLEYDSMLDECYRQILLKQRERLGERCEIGGWFEVVQPLVEEAGLEWRGRKGFKWDWHSHVGFSVGYTHEERKRLVDTYMKTFREYFGEYPVSIGSWAIDAYTLNYMAETYGIRASCNCRDQWGTDGYTLWGGYYGQAYYPSRYNMLCPANSQENQISVPIFRMLGNDPIYQVDSKMDMNPDSLPDSCIRDCMTMEPIYDHEGGGGGNTQWVDWFLQENFPSNTLSFSYLHVGQENSFEWKQQEKGTRYQLEKLKQWEREGRISLVTLKEAADWYRQTYAITPASSLTAFKDWRGLGHQSFWYQSRFYRMNVFVDEGRLYLRDMHRFCDTYRERYYDNVCISEAMCYDNLPVVDGNRWSGGSVRAGVSILLRHDQKEHPVEVEQMMVEYLSDCKMKLTVQTVHGMVVIECDEHCWCCTAPEGYQVVLRLVAGVEKLPIVSIEEKRISFKHNNFSYDVLLKNGIAYSLKRPHILQIVSEKNTVTMMLNEGCENA